jgi:drug/metabolite transporter (DMT)-like permease
VPFNISFLAGLSRNRQGILWMLAAAFLFATQDTIAKYLSADYPTIQVLWARFIVPVALLTVIYRQRLPRIVATQQLGLQLLRSVFFLGMLAFLFSAYRVMPLADANAILFFGPVILTALSQPVLSQYVGPRRWAAVVVGFIGALIVIRPGGDVFQSAALLALAAAFLAAGQHIIIPLLSRTDSAVTTFFYAPAVGAGVTSVAVGFYWVAPDVSGWTQLLGMGLLGCLSQVAIIRAFQAAPAPTVAPFQYTMLLWITLFGFVVFGDLPDIWTTVGALIVAGSGLYILHRERLTEAPAVDRTPL